MTIKCMSIFDIFKKKKEVEKKPAPPAVKKEVKKEKPAVKPAPRAAPAVGAEKKLEKPEKEIKPAKPKKAVKSEVAWKVLERPHITEKATALTEENQYIFRVSPRSNKIEIKQAVEDVYGVDVEKVRMINVPAKKRRLGKTEGWRKGYKKAIVKTKKGQEIEVLPR